MDSSLKMNIESRLYRETFLVIEKSILARKMVRMQSQSQIIELSCVECGERSATQICFDCTDHY